jgi:hypothetical protein
MAEVVRQGNSFYQVFVEIQIARHRTADLGHFQAVRQARAEQVAFVIYENLSFVYKPAKCGGMNDAIAITLEGGTPRR